MSLAVIKAMLNKLKALIKRKTVYLGNSPDWGSSTLLAYFKSVMQCYWKRQQEGIQSLGTENNLIITVVFIKRSSCITGAVSLRKKKQHGKANNPSWTDEKRWHFTWRSRDYVRQSYSHWQPPELALKVNSSRKCSKALKRFQWGTSLQLAPWLSPPWFLSERLQVAQEHVRQFEFPKFLLHYRIQTSASKMCSRNITARQT